MIPYIKGKYKKIYILYLKKRIKGKYNQYIRLPVKINRYKTIVIIDSEITEDFIFRKFVKKYNFSTRSNENLYQLFITDGLILEIINQRIKLLLFAIQQYYKKFFLKIINIVIYSIILKIS